MGLLIAVVIGGVYACGLYLMLRRSLVKLVIGLSLLSNATNLLIFASAGLTRARAPIVPGNATAVLLPVADPVPQALILTAIVIGFGVLAFTVVLIHRTYQVAATDDLDRLTSTDR